VEPDADVPALDAMATAAFTAAPAADAATRVRLWRPKRVLVTPSALGWGHGRAIVERVAALGVDVVELPSDRIKFDFPDDPRRQYAEAKATMALIVASPSKRRLQPIAPSADWRVDLAEGCPAHCNYCYLAGSLKGPPITRVYANLPEILDELPKHLGQGTITSRSKDRAHEGTTYEASCYTDPLGLEHITGSLSALIGYFGEWEADAQLRFTSKFSAVEPLLDVAHRGKTRMRVSLNPKLYARFEGGTAPVAQRIDAARRVAEAGYKVGLTIAPIIAAPGWEEAYGELLTDIGRALDGLDPDLTVELITHRYTESSKAVLDSWYPGSALDMGAEGRTQKRTKFGAVKHVYDKDTMRALRSFFEREVAERLPQARILYWT
jgi:spore photoproduct lyase